MNRLTLTLFTLLLFSCNIPKTNKAASEQTEKQWEHSLGETQIGDRQQYISIPANYSVKVNAGPDFAVFYFNPIDTANKTDFAGGIYFGRFPKLFPPDNDSCTIYYLKSRFLAKDTDWTVQNCNGKFFVQIIHDDHGDKIHAFGDAKNETDLKHLLYIFSTFKEKK